MPAVRNIEELYFCDEYQKLCSKSSYFNIFRMMRNHSKELVHSNILSALLNKNYNHGLGSLFVDGFLHQIRKMTRFSGEKIPIDTIISLLKSECIISREKYNIDIVMDFARKKVVIAIENKLYHNEGENQIKNYQNTLLKKYPSYKRYLIFLTPTGKQPGSADPNSKTAVYQASYRHILYISKSILERTEGDIRNFLKQFIIHLEGDIVGSEEVKKLCWEMFCNNEDAYRHLAANFNWCLSRKVHDYFVRIQKNIEGGELGQEWGQKLTIKPKIDDIESNKYDIDIRNQDWPAGFFIKIYKHGWLGVFPYVRYDENNKAARYELVKDLFGREPKKVRDWGKMFYLTNPDEFKDSHRQICEDGNKMEEQHINVISNKIFEYARSIDNILADRVK